MTKSKAVARVAKPLRKVKLAPDALEILERAAKALGLTPQEAFNPLLALCLEKQSGKA